MADKTITPEFYAQLRETAREALAICPKWQRRYWRRMARKAHEDALKSQQLQKEGRNTCLTQRSTD